jgi:hypothetical protein
VAIEAPFPELIAKNLLRHFGQVIYAGCKVA